jgi:ubiquinone/menaquinone biosynthesis C-methylase UbiE
MVDRRDHLKLMAGEIVGYYEKGLEAGRLRGGAEGELEYVRTQEIIRRYLPPPPGVILDVGGGPGAYALWLAEAGYEVHLVDPVWLHLDQAREASAAQPMTPIQSIRLGDARALESENDSVDTVLLLGPLYHLPERVDRIAALSEAFRVLKPGGMLFAVGISRFASTLSGLIDGFLQDEAFFEIAKRDVRDGQHRNPTEKASYFTTSFFHHPDELEAEIQETGFEVKFLLQVEGAAVFLQDLGEQWTDPVLRERILETVRWLEAEPSTLGVTGHLLAVASKG